MYLISVLEATVFQRPTKYGKPINKLLFIMDIKKYIYLFIITFLIGCFSLTAKEDQTQMLAKSKSYGFIENKGQVTDQHHNPNPAVMYLLNGNGLNVQVKQGGFSYDIFTIERKSKGVLGKAEPIHKMPGKDIPEEEITYHFHRIDITLLGSNPKAQVIAEGKSDDYTNYYNVAHAPDGILHVHQYQKITYKEIYPGIDIEYLYTEKGFKYNFVVHAGANLSDIQLQYKGAPFTASGQTLIFNTSQGECKESIPASWLIKNGLNQNVQVDYTLLDKETIGFKTKAQIASFDLVVDPSPGRVWGTYYGAASNEKISSVSTDGIGDIYFTGESYYNTNISTIGSHQSSHSGSGDAFLVKFNTSGVRIWGTYYGSSLFERGNAVSIDIFGNIYLVGETLGSSNISTSGSHQSAYGGGWDAFLVKFGTSGIRLWATYYGGGGDDRFTSIDTDGSGNIFISGTSGSINNIATSGSFQTLNWGQNSILVKFNSNGVRQWGTYYGTSANSGKAVCTDPFGNVFLAGVTNSGNNITTTGSHQTNFGGDQDAFLVKFNTNGVRQWGTYYGGNLYDIINSITSDGSGNIYVVGETKSTTNISSVISHQNQLGGDWDGFLAKFSNNGGRQWATYIGGTLLDLAYSVTTDKNENIIVSGVTESTTSISSISGHQVNYNGGPYDAFINKFTPSGNRLWGSYYGGNGQDLSTSCASDFMGNHYMVGITSSSSDISTIGSHQSNFGGGFLTKLQDCISPGTLGNIGAINNPSSIYCSSTNYTFTITPLTTNADGYWWKVPAGWVIVAGQTTNSVTVRPTSSGSISVKAYNNCGDSTTAASRSITVTAAPAQPSAISTSQGQLINGIRTLCNGTSATFTVTNVSGLTYNWTFPSGWGGSGTTNSTTRTVGLLKDTIRVKAVNATTGCSSIEQNLYVQVFQIPVTPATIQGPAQACRTLTNLYTVDSVPFATSYNWIVPTGWTINSGAGTRSIVVSAGTGSGNISVTASNFCNASSPRTLAVTSAAAPAQSSAISGPTSLCAGTNNLTYSVTAVSAVQYRWVLPSNWQIVSGANTNQITVNVPSDATGGMIQVYPANTSNPLCEGPVRALSASVTTFGTPGSINGSSNVCSGNATSYSLSSISGATSYVWTIPSGWTGSSTSTLINSTVGSATGDFTISVRGVNGTCSSAVAQLPITVHAQVGLPSNIAGSTSICENSAQTYSIPAVANATNYNWSLPAGWSFDGPTNTNSINILSGNNSGTFNLGVQATNLGCSSQVRTIGVTNNLTPQIGVISGLTNTCQGANQSYSVSATNAVSYTWTLPTGWTGSSATNSINITFNGIADTLRVVANGLGGCNSSQTKRYINVQANPPQPAVTGLTQACSVQYETYRVNKIASASTYTWTIPSGWNMSPSNGISSDTTILIQATNGQAGNITVKATTSNGCVGAERVYNISTISTTVPSAPTAIAGDNSFCVGVSKTYSIPAVSGATGYAWTVPSGWTISGGQNTTNITVIPGSNTGVIQVQTVQGACKSTSRNISVFSSYAKANKPQNITPSSMPACESSAITLTVNAVAGASSYQWQLPSDWSFMGDPSLRTVQVRVGSNDGNVTVRGKNDGCISDSSVSLGVTVNKLPQFLGGIAGEKYVKTNSIRSYSISASNATGFSWDIPSDWLLLSGINTNTISVLTGSQNALLRVSAINNCGSRSTDLLVNTGVSASIHKQQIFNNLEIYPNPASSLVHITYDMPVNAEVHYQLLSLSGQLLYAGKLNGLKGTCPIDVSDLAQGIYLLQFTNEQEEKFTHKIQLIK